MSMRCNEPSAWGHENEDRWFASCNGQVHCLFSLPTATSRPIILNHRAAICWFLSNVASHQISSYLYTYIYHAAYTEARLLCFFYHSHRSLDRLPGPSHHSYWSRRGAKTRDWWMDGFLCSKIKRFTKRGHMAICLFTSYALPSV